MKRVSALITITIACAFIGVACLVIWRQKLTGLVGEDVFKLSYQFLLMLVLGGAVSLIYGEFNRVREDTIDRRKVFDEQRAAARRSRQAFLSDVVEAYNATKRIRRIIRARVVSTAEHGQDSYGSEIRSTEYDKQMQLLLDVQLQLEFLVKRVQVEGLFVSPSEISASLKSMEAYLRALLSEYETSFERIRSGQTSLSELPLLFEFIGPYEKADNFRIQFVYQFHAVFERIKKVLADEHTSNA